jgi:hypothetical protein
MGYRAIGGGPKLRPSEIMNPPINSPEVNSAFREVASAILRKFKEDPEWILARVPPGQVTQRRLLQIIATGAKDAEIEVLFGIPLSSPSSLRRCQRRGSCRSCNRRKQA